MYYTGLMSDVFSLRLPNDGLKLLRRIARRSRVGPTQLARTWLLERLAQEAQATARPSGVREPSPVYGAAAVRAALPQERLPEVAAVCRRHGVARLGVFGSAARRDFDPGRSDVDFTVSFLEMPLGLQPAAYFGLIEDLERLCGRSVDLVDRESVRNPYLRAEIERDEIVLYETS